MSSINDLLNHEQSGGSERRESAASLTPTGPFDAADALTALATLGSGQQYAAGPTRDLPSPTAFSNAPRRTSSVGSHHGVAAPSPTLEQYHHGSQSPEEQKRRQSLMETSSPAPVLAPIQNLSSALHEHTQDDSSSTSIGKHVSQIVPPPSRSSEGGEPAQEVTQELDESTTSQIRKPDEVKAESLSISQDHDAQGLSPQPIIKNEPTGTPRESTPAIIATHTERHNSITGEMLDAETLRALEVAKQADLGLRKKRMGSESVAPTVDTKSALAPSKKRPAPSSVSVPKKKGTAKAVKPSKKRKIDPEDESTARSVTPSARPPKSATHKNIKRGSQAGTPALESSPAPDNSSQVAASDDDGDSSEDHNLYCICKKPDNHKWMIGCDGGCDDWFHGDCVNMKQADEGLVDRFICPLCEENGRGHTTWKPMCRRDGCRRPARLIKDRDSKYCSEECGTLFMTEQLQRTAGAIKANGTSTTKDKSKKKKKATDGTTAEEEEPTPLGGTLRSKDLKALVDASPNIQAFRNLGTGVLSPPQTASPTRASFNGDASLALTTGETERLTALHKEKSQLQDRLEVLKDREKFVSMAKEQALRVAEREKIKAKEFCGYDCRLSWSDAEFLLWRNRPHGKASFRFSTLSPTSDQIGSVDAVLNDEAMATDAVDAETVCLKKRCSKHPQWQKLNLQDARFEELEVVEAIRECEKEEKSVRERARRRGAKDGLAKELMVGEGGGVERNREGWVEVVGS